MTPNAGGTAAAPVDRSRATPGAKPLLEVRDLNIAFDTERGQVRPVRDVSFSIYPGQTVALVGESGCGKSVTSLSVLRLIPQPPGKFLGGSVHLEGRDLLDLSEKQMRSVRGKEIAMIFQEPMTSLNPVYTIGDQIAEAVVLHQHANARQAIEIAEQALRDVGIADPGRRLAEYPHQMSGGMRQRVMIAMALSCKPKLLIADEPTTALDVTIQAQILELLRRLQRETGMSILLITHDLGVVAENADVVNVMYASRIVETATVEDLFDRPQHPYTEGLFRSVPKLGAHASRLETIAGTVPNPSKFPSGCKFHTRCPRTRMLAAQASPQDVVTINTGEETFPVLRRCQQDEPILREVLPLHGAACHQIAGYDVSPPIVPRSDHRREVVPQAVEEGNPEAIVKGET
ncbi:MAG TPA: ABC transporter ATP-binding protein [Tepidisphaeraceae bacterium]|nr:ABC transporter ATP-binding protein [Tepidisphaeraceae bacterium]